MESFDVQDYPLDKKELLIVFKTFLLVFIQHRVSLILLLDIHNRILSGAAVGLHARLIIALVRALWWGIVVLFGMLRLVCVHVRRTRYSLTTCRLNTVIMGLFDGIGTQFDSTVHSS